MFSIKTLKLKRPLLFDLLIITFTFVIFYLVKAGGFSYRFGDGNAYFYMAEQILSGFLPYRDFLIADPPLLILLLAGIKSVIGSNIILFQAVPIVLETMTALVIYLEVKKSLPNYAKFFPVLYLFSFLILATTDYLTGLHFVTLLIALAYYFRKNPYLSGFFWGLATLIKLYVIPGFLGWLLWLKLSGQIKNIRKTILAYITTGTFFMLPFLFIAPKTVINYIIIHQFNRPIGLSKINIFRFFVLHDFTLLLLTTASLVLTKNKKLLLPIIAWLNFYLIFKDLYYLYLGVLAFWLVLAVKQLLLYFKNQKQPPWLAENQAQLSAIVITTLILSQAVGVYLYQQSTQQQGQFAHVETAAAYIKNLPVKPLYGSHEVAPLVALKSERKLLGNYADTNAQLFGSGVLNKKQISQQVVEQGAYLLVKIANIPQNPNLDHGFDGFFDQEIFDQYCHRLTIIDGPKEELFTDIGIYNCEKNSSR